MVGDSAQKENAVRCQDTERRRGVNAALGRLPERGFVQKREEVMTSHQAQMWITPIVAIILGLLLFATSKDKWATVGGYVFLCGFLIFLWLITFGGLPAR